MQQGRYHPITQARLVGGFDADNDLTALRIRISGQSILASLRPEAQKNTLDPIVFQGLTKSGDAAIGYSAPNLLIDHSMRNPHVPPGFWRGVNVNTMQSTSNASWTSSPKQRDRTRSFSGAS